MRRRGNLATHADAAPLAVPFLLVWCRWRGVTPLRRDGTLPAELLAGGAFLAAFFCIFRALELTSAARLVVLFYNTPFFAVIGTHFLAGTDRLTLRKLLGLGLALLSLPVLFADRLGAPLDTALSGDVRMVERVCGGRQLVALLNAPQKLLNLNRSGPITPSHSPSTRLKSFDDRSFFKSQFSASTWGIAARSSLV